MSAIRDLLSGLSSRRRTRNYDLTNLSLLAGYLEEYLIPVGSIVSKFTDVSPGEAWVQIAGQSLSKADFPQLYADIGGKFGEDELTFDLPDLSETYLTGTNELAGAFIGANEVTLTVDQMPEHGHEITDPGHSHVATSPPHSHQITDPGHIHTITDPGHTHSVDEAGSIGDAATGSDEVTVQNGGNTGNSTTGVSVDSAETGVTINDATATVSVESAQTGVSVNQSGGGDSFNNRPHSIEVYYFMKAKM